LRTQNARVRVGGSRNSRNPDGPGPMHPGAIFYVIRSGDITRRCERVRLDRGSVRKGPVS
jgi:hypothetical protein